MNEDEKISFGVIGVGRIGKIHLKNLTYHISAAEVVAVADVYPDELNKVAKQFNIPTAVKDYREVLKLSNIDAVAVCSPTTTHAQIVQEAAAAGKHIFCEKPIDLSLEKIEKTIDQVKRCGVKFQVGFNRRFDSNFSKIHELIKSGKIGEPQILRISSRDPMPPSLKYLKTSGGIFLDMTIHDFDMARYLMNSEVEEIFAKGNVLIDPIFKQANDFDTIVVTLTFENGAMGTIDNSRQAVYGYDQRAEVFGSEGMVLVNNNKPDNHIHLNKTGTHSALPLNFFMDRYTESYLTEMKAFVECIIGGTIPPVTGHDGLLAVIIGLAAKKSVNENRPIKLSEI